MAPTHANISRVATNLWIGGDLETRSSTLARLQLADLQHVGITGIVDCRIEWSDQELVAREAPEIVYRWLGVDDAGQQVPDGWFEAGTQQIREWLEDGRTVLAHCHMGINRGPSMGYAAMLATGWDPIDALDHVREARPVAYVGYAEDALDWWLRKTGAGATERRAWRRRLGSWRRENHLDVARVIRMVRHGEGA
ncbi:hypothetical protein GCM10028801_28340 [Nocardioides maradonensis]